MTVTFVVRKRVGDEYSRDDIPAPQDQYWASFDDRAAAEAHARELDWAHVRSARPVARPDGGNPFASGLAGATDMPEYVFEDWLRDAGIDPPPPPEPVEPHPWRQHWMADDEWAAEQRRWDAAWAARTENQRAEERRRWAAGRAATRWRDWWAAATAPDGLTADQVARVWEALTPTPFYEVVEVPAADPPPAPPAGATVYAVVHQCWEYDDCWYHGANNALSVYRTRAAAEAARDRQTVALGADGECVNGGPNVLVVVELQLAPGG